MSQPRTPQPVVFIHGVTFAYNGEPALEDIHFTVYPGDYVAVVGPNGGGKTTLIKLILGLLRPQRGQVLVCGQDPRHRHAPIGYVPQHAAFQGDFPITVLETVLMGLPRHGRRTPGYRKDERAKALAMLDDVDLASMAHRRLDTLSGGQKQRALVARALMTDPQLLLFDEPTANIDPQGKVCLFDLFARLIPQRTIIVVSHDLIATASHVTSVAVVNRRLLQHHTIDEAMLTLMYGEHSPSCPISPYLHRLRRTHRDEG